jgi:nucleoside-diphosphate-sugar epimerase
MVWGPDDPDLGQTAILARNILRRRVPIRIPGGVPVVDVHDVAAVHAAVLEAGGVLLCARRAAVRHLGADHAQRGVGARIRDRR